MKYNGSLCLPFLLESRLFRLLLRQSHDFEGTGANREGLCAILRLARRRYDWRLIRHNALLER